MKRVLVTGAAGFLGSHLMLHHLRQGDHVLGVDNFCSSDPNSDHVKLIKEFDVTGLLIDGDITDGKLWDIIEKTRNKEYINDSDIDDRFDIIYNFGCPASPPIYQAMPVLTMMTCVVGTAAVLDLAQKHSAIVVHASTSEVYGDPVCSPQPESYVGNVNSYGPRSCYDEGKRAAEALCFDYLNMYQTDVRLVRIFNTYGPHMEVHDGRVVTNFIQQSLVGDKMTIYGDGSQTRSLCYVDDLIDGIIKVGQLKENPRTPINLGNPNEFTMIELARLIQQKTSFHDSHAELNVVYKPLPKDDPTRRCPDITLARSLLGWEPKISLSEGLNRMIPYMKREMKK